MQDPESSQVEDHIPPKKKPPHPGSLSPSPSRTPSSKLRYDAYEPPKPLSRLPNPLKFRRSSSRSTVPSDDGGNFRSPKSEGRLLAEDLSRTVSAGDLALATGNIELETINKVCGNEVDIWSSRKHSNYRFNQELQVIPIALWTRLSWMIWCVGDLHAIVI